jgi:hypothetical protein
MNTGQRMEGDKVVKWVKGRKNVTEWGEEVKGKRG